MLKDKRVNISFLVSLSVHLIILVLVGGLKFYQRGLFYTLTEVELIGTTLLPQGAPELKEAGLPRELESLEKKTEITEEIQVTREEEKISKEEFSIFKEEPEEKEELEKKETRSPFDLGVARKEIPRGLERVKKRIYRVPGIEKPSPAKLLAGDLNITGPIAEAKRGIIYKEYPVHTKNIEVKILLKFWVEPDGRVTNVSPLQKGNAELEKRAIEAMKKWRFEPLPKSAKQIRQWGIIPLKFILR